MFKTYLKLALRNLWKNKLYSAINVAGLAIGLTACLLIVLFVNDEMSYDKHFEDSEQIYRLTGAYNQGGNGRNHAATVSYPLMPVITDNFPEVEQASRIAIFSGVVSNGDQHVWQEDVAYVDSTFFDVFSYQSVLGDHINALDDPLAIVITQSAAEVHFGDVNPIDQILRYGGVDFRVAAVVKNTPDNTHFNADMFIPVSTTLQWYGNYIHILFSGTSHLLYFKLANEADPKVLETRINTFLNQNYERDDPHQYFVQALEDIHLNSDLSYELQENGNITTVLIFIATAVVILILAAINYINLSIAGSFQRGKEVGLKKIFGARNGAQVTQFQFESIIIALLACVIAIVLVEITLPAFNNLTNKTFSFGLVDNASLLFLLFGMGLIIGLVSGSFPALFLLKMKTTDAMKGNVFNKSANKFSVRNGLVTFQFFIAVVLIVSTIVILDQVKFLKNSDLGINKEQVLVIPIQTNAMAAQYDLFSEELKRNAQILGVTATSNNPTSRVGGWRGYWPDNQEEQVYAPTVTIGHDYFETMGTEIIQGRSFDREFATDYLEAYVINESAVDFFNLENPIGTPLPGMAYTGQEWTRKNAVIIGVVKDFHFASLHAEIRPVVFTLASEVTRGVSYMNVKISPENMNETLSFIRDKWVEFSPERPFRYNFLDEQVDELYRAENQFLDVFKVFSTLAIFIGCLGLFGLTGFIMKLKVKDIGIRKVLGASQASLLNILSKTFLIQVLIANLLGWPIGYFLMNKWLENFAYQIKISATPFAITGGVILLVTFVTIAYHTLKTAVTNPIESLRNE